MPRTLGARHNKHGDNLTGYSSRVRGDSCVASSVTVPSHAFKGAIIPAVLVATQYASAPCKLTISSQLFARWRCCSGITISSYLFARWHLFLHVGYLRHQQQVDLWPFDLESRVRVTCYVGYLYANFSLPRPLCSRVRPDVRDRQTSDRQTSDVRQKHRLMPPPYEGRRIIIIIIIIIITQRLTRTPSTASYPTVRSGGHWDRGT